MLTPVLGTLCLQRFKILPSAVLCRDPDSPCRALFCNNDQLTVHYPTISRLRLKEIHNLTQNIDAKIIALI